MTYTVLAVVSAIDLPFQISLELAEREQARAFVFADPAVGDLVDGDGIEVVQLLAPAPECRHEIRFLQNSEMLGDRLAGHVAVFAKLGQRLPVAGTQAVRNCRLTESASARKTASMPMQANMQPFGCLFRREMAALRRSGLLACDPGGFEYRTDCAASVGWRRASVLEQEPAVAIFEAMQAGEEREPEQVLAQRLVGKHDRRDVAQHQAADLHPAEPHRRAAHRAVGGLELRDIIARRGMKVQARRIALGQGAGVEKGFEPAPVARALDPEMTTTVWLDDAPRAAGNRF